MTESTVDIAPTPIEEIDRKVERLKANAGRWPPPSAELLRDCMGALAEVRDGWVAACCDAKGYEAGSNGHGEELLGGVLAVMRNLRLFAEALEQRGEPTLPNAWQRADGQWVARVFPQNMIDRALFAGTTVDVWIEPGQEPTQGRLYRIKSRLRRRRRRSRRVVLGVGNRSIPAMTCSTSWWSTTRSRAGNEPRDRRGRAVDRASLGASGRGFLEAC